MRTLYPPSSSRRRAEQECLRLEAMARGAQTDRARYEAERATKARLAAELAAAKAEKERKRSEAAAAAAMGYDLKVYEYLYNNHEGRNMHHHDAIKLAQTVKVDKLDSSSWIDAHREAYEYATNQRLTGWWATGIGLSNDEGLTVAAAVANAQVRSHSWKAACKIKNVKDVPVASGQRCAAAIALLTKARFGLDDAAKLRAHDAALGANKRSINITRLRRNADATRSMIELPASVSGGWCWWARGGAGGGELSVSQMCSLTRFLTDSLTR